MPRSWRPRSRKAPRTAAAGLRVAPLALGLVRSADGPAPPLPSFRALFDVEERGDERDLKVDLLATKRWRCLQGRDLVESAGELLCGFNQRRTGERSLPSLAPQASGFLNQPRFSAVTSQQLGAVLGDTRVELTARLA